MRLSSAFLGALLVAAPFAALAQHGHDHGAARDPRGAAAYLLRFTLEEGPEQVVEKIGHPVQVADFGPNYQTWQYQIDVHDKHDFSHAFCFRQEDRRLVSVTRNWEEEVDVTELFPARSSAVHHWPDAKRPEYSVRVRRLPGGRLLIAMGAGAGPEALTRQLMLLRRTAVAHFLPWLDSQLAH